MERYLCDTCLYANNCQFIAKHKGGAIGCSAYINTFGVSIDRLRELVEAEKDGRLVVLPCKVGETVYVPTSQVCDDCIISGVIQYFVVYETFTDAAAIFNQGASVAFIARVKTENIGKTVFFTREEAEAALKEE